MRLGDLDFNVNDEATYVQIDSVIHKMYSTRENINAIEILKLENRV